MKSNKSFHVARDVRRLYTTRILRSSCAGGGAPSGLTCADTLSGGLAGLPLGRGRQTSQYSDSSHQIAPQEVKTLPPRLVHTALLSRAYNQPHDNTGRLLYQPPQSSSPLCKTHDSAQLGRLDLCHSAVSLAGSSVPGGKGTAHLPSNLITLMADIICSGICGSLRASTTRPYPISRRSR